MLDITIHNNRSSTAQSADKAKALFSSFVPGSSSNPLMLKAIEEIEMQQMVAMYVDTTQSAETTGEVDPQLPQLTQPAMSVAEQIAEGKANDSVYALLTQFKMVLEKSSSAALKSRLDDFLARAEGKQGALEKVAQELNELLKTLDQSSRDFEKAKSDLINANLDLNRAELLVELASDALARALAAYQAAKNAHSVNPSEQNKQALNAAVDEITKKQDELTKAQTDQPEAIRQTLEARSIAQQKLLISADTFDKASAAFNTKLDQMPADLRPDRIGGSIGKDKNLEAIHNSTLNAAALLTKLMLEFQDLVRDSNNEELKRKLADFEKQQQAVQTHLEAQTTSMVEDQSTGTDIMNGVMWGGLALGLLISLAGVGAAIASIVTGGLSVPAAIGLLTAGVGAIIAAVDIGLYAAGEKTITERALQPLIEGVIIPFTKLVVDWMYNEVLKNVADEQARRVWSNILGGLIVGLTILAVLATAIVGGGAAAARIATTAVGKALLAPITKAAVQAGEAFAIRLSKFNLVAALVGGVGGAVEAGIGGVGSWYQTSAMRTTAELNLDYNALSNISKYIAKASEEFARLLKVETDLSEQVHLIAEDLFLSLNSVIKNIRA